MPKPKYHVFVCTTSRPPGNPRGSCAGDRGSRDVFMQFFEELDKHDLVGQAQITDSGCLGPCAMGPTVVVYPDGVWYQGVKPDDVSAIVEEHLVGGKPVERLIIPDEMWG